MTMPDAIAVVAERTHPSAHTTLRDLQWMPALAMLKQYPLVVATAFDRLRIELKAPVVIGCEDPADVETAVQHACVLLDSNVCCIWVFACNGDTLRRAVGRAHLNGVVGGHA